LANNDKKRQRGLGRGLSALMSDVSLDQPVDTETTTGEFRGERMMPVESLEPNPDQPRHRFAEDKLEDLASSIREKGVLQPLIVRAQGEKYQIVAGERRWRAAQMAQVHAVPVVVRELNDTEVLEIGIIENIQRADLNPIEEALGYVQLIDRFGHTQDQLAKALGKSRSHIANMMRLMSLPTPIHGMLEDGSLSVGHARALITLDDDRALSIAREITAKGLSVRDTEKLIKPAAKPKPPRKRTVSLEKDADTRALENDLSANLGLKVEINHKNDGGDLTISYRDLDDLDALCQILTASPLAVTK
jgi:ParB family chromosome partitioning protein